MNSRFLLTLAATSVLAVAACKDDDEPTGPAPIQFRAALTGAAERPTPVTTPGTGTADFTIKGDSLNFTINVTGLTSTIVGAHIHVGGTEVAGPIIFPFTVQSTAQTGTVASGSLNMRGNVSATVTGDSLRKLMDNGNAYVNVHTMNFRGGEVRGQIVRR